MDENSVQTANRQPNKVKKMEVGPMNIVFTVYAIFTYLSDVGFDIFVAVNHYNNGDITYFILTVCFVAIPAMIMSGFSILWYLYDAKANKIVVSTKQWIVRGIFLILCLAPVVRHLEAIYCAWKSIKGKTPNEKQRYARKMIFENTDAMLLRLFESFLECGPQLVLQIYIFAVTQSRSPNVYTGTEIIQLVSISTSLFSMSFAISSYLRSLRNSLDHKNELSWSKSTVLLLWRFFELTARVMALGLFASVKPGIVFIISCAHFILMSIWICTMNTDFCDNHWGECIYNHVLSIMFIFCYFNPKDTPSRNRCIFYYVLVFIENTAMMAVWFHYYTPYAFVSWKLPAMIMQFVNFGLGVGIMILFYLFLHPTIGKADEEFEERLRDREADLFMSNLIQQLNAAERA